MIFVSYYIFVYYLKESAIIVDSFFLMKLFFYIFYLDKYYKTKINYNII